MYNVLLADDEIYDLEGLKTFIPWENLGMRVAAAVNNGFDAYRVFETEPIDILVIDVRMPGMTGLELAEKAMRLQSGVRIIFVSGYQDFQYVKKAISLNAASYVLKPTDDNELIEALKKIREELDLERKRLEAEQVYRQMIRVARNEYMLQLLEGSYDRHTLDVLNREYRLDRFEWPGSVAVLEIDDLAWKLNPYTGTEKRELLAQFTGNVIKVCAELGIDHICRLSGQRIALLVPGEADEPSMLGIIRGTCEGLPFTVTIGIGNSASEPSGLEESYRQAQEALDYKMFYGKGRPIGYQRVKTAEIQDVNHLNMQLDSLFKAMTNYDVVRIHDELDEIFRLSADMGSKLTIHNYAMYLIMKLDGHLHKINEDLFQLLGFKLQNLDILLQFETIEDIRTWFRRKLFEIAETLRFRKRTKNWKLIGEVIEYMKGRLHENIELRDMAESFSFTPNYLGMIFKEETGRTFSEYLIMLRMQKAVELLRDSKLKIYEVAEQVGYRYMSYFSRQFKETFGMTPIEYKRNN